MPLLILNAGSSSLKFTVIDLATEQVSRRGTLNLPPSSSESARTDAVMPALLDSLDDRIAGVVHRIVHGGPVFSRPVHLTPQVRDTLNELTPMAPLHNPPSLALIDAALRKWPDIPHVAVFDTAFHATLTPESYTYALPHEWSSQWGLRRFGFHGFSHAYAAQRAAEMLDRAPAGLHLIVAHLGSGASVSAIRSGMSVDTTMGFTPLEGLMMGTRCGSVDPGLLLYLQQTCGLKVSDLVEGLYMQSGLLGVSGVSSDMQEVLAAADAGDARAGLAVRMFVNRARQAIGAMAATLGRADALIFTGGIGEHSAEVRAAICETLSCVGLRLDPTTNLTTVRDAVISSADSPGAILVIASREDLMMVRAVKEALPALLRM
jgi:acetate kinase